MREGLGEIGSGAGLGLLDGVQQAEQLALAGRRRDVVHHVFVEDDQAGGIALLVRQIAKRSGDEARVVQFIRPRAEPIRHGGAGIQQDQQLRIGLAAVAFQSSTRSVRAKTFQST